MNRLPLLRTSKPNSTKSAVLPKPNRNSTKPSRTSVKPSALPKPQILISATTTPSSTVSTKEFFADNSSVLSQENDSFCHPNCTGIFVAIAFASLCGVALVISIIFVSSKISKRRRLAKSGTTSSTSNSDLSPSATDIIDRTENNYDSNQIDAQPSVIVSNRNIATLHPPQVAIRRPPLVSDSNSTGLNGISDQPYTVVTLVAKQKPNSTQKNPPRIYLELMSDESDAGPLPPTERPVNEEHVYYNLGLMGVDNIEYEICDCRVQPASSVAPNLRKAPVPPKRLK